ncbi:MAG: GTPase HflX [Chloroflexi bacterium]|nr:GTPase HflX [Chloroflexota bacterium]
MSTQHHNSVELVLRRADASQPVGERAFLFALEWPQAEGWGADESLDELARLGETAGLQVVGRTVQHRSRPDPRTFIGRGKVEEVAALRDQLGFELAVCDDELSPAQQRNLERDLRVRVMDRTELILRIFAQRAHTREAQLQVDLARLEYLLPRLAGAWSHLERQRGGTGTRGGPGETQIELDRRQVRAHMAALRRELETVRTRRARARAHRADKLPVVALIGYTNAGKSTLFNALTGAEVEAENRLFATLDPTIRRMQLPDGGWALLSDTVGFIQKLPHQLVAAFRATLEELRDADLLLHVVDASHPMASDQATAVYDVLEELDLGEKPLLCALNKADLLDGQPPSLTEEGPLVSALHQRGLDELRAAIAHKLGQAAVEVEVEVPYADGGLAALFRSEALVVDSERYLPGGIVLRGRLPVHVLRTFTEAGTVRSLGSGTRRQKAEGRRQLVSASPHPRPLTPDS